jgi:hypothetical protein
VAKRTRHIVVGLVGTTTCGERKTDEGLCKGKEPPKVIGWTFGNTDNEETDKGYLQRKKSGRWWSIGVVRGVVGRGNRQHL